VQPNPAADSALGDAGVRIGVLASREGTILQAVLDAAVCGQLDAEVSIVISNNGDAGALAKAQAASVRAVHLSATTHPDPDELDAAILGALREARVRLVLLAGYMKKIGPKTLAAYPGRVLNTHPALLPAYGGKGMYGRRVYESVLAAGENHTGVTVHRVDGEYDHGDIVAQVRVPILEGDDVESLSARVREVERRFVVQTLQALVHGRTPDGAPLIASPLRAGRGAAKCER
jgi:phosphoribosylglycinamide formyltransferase-1